MLGRNVRNKLCINVTQAITRDVRLCVISSVQHEEAIGVNSMTELLSLPEELISWEFDGQAIIATGTLLTSLGQVAGCRAEYQHSAEHKFKKHFHVGRFVNVRFSLKHQSRNKILLFFDPFIFFTQFSRPKFHSERKRGISVGIDLCRSLSHRAGHLW